MPSATLFRLAGMALIAALPLSVPGYFIHPRTHELADVAGSTTTLSHAIVAVAWALVLLGLPGLYAFHAQRSGRLGLVGFVLMMLFVGYHAYLLLYEAGPVAMLSGDAAAERLFAPGGIVRQGMLREWVMPVTILAPVVYGLALVRTGPFSRWAGWLVIAFIPAFFVLNGVLAFVPSATRQDLLDLGYANFGLGVSFCCSTPASRSPATSSGGAQRPTNECRRQGLEPGSLLAGDACASCLTLRGRRGPRDAT